MKLRIIMLFTSLITNNSYAITDQERAALQRLNDELTLSLSIIDQAQHYQLSEDRRAVDYSLLKRDLNKIISGVNDAVNAKRRNPRLLPDINGDYLQ